MLGYLRFFILFGVFRQTSADASKCWTCTNEANFLDCRANGYLATCTSGDTGGCQTEVRNNNGVLQVTKKCKAKSVCESEVTQYASQSATGFNTAGAVCYFCCTTDNCNVAIEGECVNDCQHVPEGNYHSCESCSKYRSCASSASTEMPCAGGLVWNDKTKGCDWETNSKTCPDYANIGTAEAFKCWNCENQLSFEACNDNGNWQTCNEGDTGGCQTRITYRDGALDRISKKCKQLQTCESEATNTDSRCPPSTQVHTASNLDCNFCCTKSKCNQVATDSCTDTCDGISATDYQSCIQCDVYISCTADPTDNRPCAMGQDGNRLHWDNSIPTCVAASSTCPAGNGVPASSACDNSPCLNDGVCTEADGGYSCECVEGFKGTECDETDECSPDPCQNSGVCTDGDNDYTCECTTGYKGTDCAETDECSPNPCQNSGVCTDGDNDYTCECTTGYKGTDCADTDECSPDPCQNSGVCTDGDNDYTCECTTGYKGTDCADTDECSPNPCQNSGVCTDGDNDYTCECTTGYKGTDCADTDECSPNPCQNSGNCIDGDTTYTCACASGYTGQNCQTASPDASVCDNNPCQNGGTCGESGKTYTCTCVTGFNGDNCETEDQPATGCDLNPCHNGGTCDDSGDPYTCSCTSGYTGTDCQEETSVTCDDTPCQNEGECETTDGGYNCICTTDYTGTNCESKSDSSLGGSDAQSGDENAASESGTSNDAVLWYGLGAGLSAALVGAGCLIFFLAGKKPSRDKEDEKEANGVPPATTTMPHAAGTQQQTTFNSLSPAPVETVNEIAW